MKPKAPLSVYWEQLWGRPLEHIPNSTFEFCRMVKVWYMFILWSEREREREKEREREREIVKQSKSCGEVPKNRICEFRN